MMLSRGVCLTMNKDLFWVEAHSRDAGGHFSGEITSRKIFQSSLWWPRVIKDAH